MQSRFRQFVVLFLALALAPGGCGFRLAGTEQLPQEVAAIHLEAPDLTPQQIKTLQQFLKRAGATIRAAAGGDAVVLTVSLAAPPDRRILSSASSGKTVELVTRELTFSLKDAAGTTLIAPRTLSQQSDLIVDDDNLLAAGEEKTNLIRDMQRALFNQLIRQLIRI